MAKEHRIIACTNAKETDMGTVEGKRAEAFLSPVLDRPLADVDGLEGRQRLR